MTKRGSRLRRDASLDSNPCGFESPIGRRPLLCALGALAFGVAGCGGAPPDPATPGPGGNDPQPAAAKAKNAAQIAVQLVGGRVGALIFADKTRGHPAVGKLLALPPVQSAVGGTGIDLQRDVDRAFVTAPSVRERSDVIGVLMHHLGDREVVEALQKRIDQNRPTYPNDGFITGQGFTVARITVKGDTRIVALPERGIAVILPQARLADAARWVGTGGLPDPSGAEAALLRSDQPSQTLAAPRVPPFPPTLSRADGIVFLTPDGGARIHVDGTSTDDHQAQNDARVLTQGMIDATSVRVPILGKVQVFRTVPFRAEGSHVKADLALSSGEIDTIVGMIPSMMP